MLSEIVYGISLVFSLHILLFSILFYVNAFETPHLILMKDLWRLFVEDGWQEMQLFLKKEMDNYYVFPKVDLIFDQPCILWETLMNEHTLDTQLRTFSEIHGFLDHLFFHQFQYSRDDLLDKSDRWTPSHSLDSSASLDKSLTLNLFPDFVSEAQCNVIMMHASSRIFIKHYQPWRHTGLQEIMCSLNPNEELSRAVMQMSCWIDWWWPWYLNDADQTLVKKNLKLQSAIQWQVELKTQCDDCSSDPALQALLEDQEHKVNNLCWCLQNRQWKKVCCEFSWKQVVIDIKRQLTDGAVSNKPACEVLQKEFTMSSEQILLVKTFFTWLTTDSLEDKWAWCNKAVAAGIQYCGFQKDGLLWEWSKCPASSDNEDQVSSSKTWKRNPNKQLIVSWKKEHDFIRRHILGVEKSLMCFQCFKTYSDHNGIKRHFKTLYLRDCQCNFCNLAVLHEMHLHWHAEEMHCLCI